MSLRMLTLCPNAQIEGFYILFEDLMNTQMSGQSMESAIHFNFLFSVDEIVYWGWKNCL